MNRCGFPLDGRKGNDGVCTLRAGHNGDCVGNPANLCPDCDMLLPEACPAGRCDRCEFKAKVDEDFSRNVNKDVFTLMRNAETHKKELEDLGITDPVNSPAHYNQGKIECIDAIKEMLGDGFKAYCRGQVLKYLWRAEYKGNTKEDLRKAQWYMNMLVGEDPRE